MPPHANRRVRPPSYAHSHACVEVVPEGGRSIRPGRAAQPPAGPARNAVPAAVHRSQHPAHKGEAAALSACPRGALAGNRPAGRHTGHVLPSSPRGDPVHGPDDVKDTRTRHDAPSPVQFRTHNPGRRRGHPGPPPRTAPARHPRQRRENLPPRNTEQPARALIRRAPRFQADAPPAGLATRLHAEPPIGGRELGRAV